MADFGAIKEHLSSVQALLASDLTDLTEADLASIAIEIGKTQRHVEQAMTDARIRNSGYIGSAEATTDV